MITSSLPTLPSPYLFVSPIPSKRERKHRYFSCSCTTVPNARHTSSLFLISRLFLSYARKTDQYHPGTMSSSSSQDLGECVCVLPVNCTSFFVCRKLVSTLTNTSVTGRLSTRLEPTVVDSITVQVVTDGGRKRDRGFNYSWTELRSSSLKAESHFKIRNGGLAARERLRYQRR